MVTRPEDLQATFCATLVDEWVRRGVSDAVVAPGSRSTPMAMALADHPGIRIHVQHDERSAGFLALGLALGTGLPAIVLTTSGTAAAELHPAVVEADLAQVPVLVCTADRPPELRDVGAPQAIDQTHLFGHAVRWFHEPVVADESTANRWRSLAARSLAEATGPAPGPVHLNLAFREPLLGTARPLPPVSPDLGVLGDRRPPTLLLAGTVVTLVDELADRRGVFIAGAGSGPGRSLHELAANLGWPVIAAPQARVWGVPGAVIAGVDAMLRSSWLRDALRPQVVVRLGTPLASRVVGEWVAASGAYEIAAAGPGRWVDPHGTADVVLPIEPGTLVGAWAAAATDLVPANSGHWLDAWQEAGHAAQAAIEHHLATIPAPTEPAVAHEVMAALPDGADLVVSSSMPVRDLEWYARPRAGVRVHANRGANGIDGVVSTAVGVAAGSGRPTALLVGDIAFLHDSNGLLGLAQRDVSLVIVVVDNDGGGIFSFLPQAGVIDGDRFEALFGTPHGLDLVTVARAYGVDAQLVADVGPAVQAALAAGGVHVLVVRTDRHSNVALHDDLHHAVAVALDAAG